MRAPVPSLLFLLAVCLLTIPQYGCGNDAQSKAPESQEEDETFVPVEAAVVESGSIDAVFTGTATLEAEEEAVVVARTGGIVKELFAEEGDYVEAGQPLAQLDRDRLELELNRAEVTLARLNQDFDRHHELYEKKLIAPEEYEASKSEYELQQQVRDLARLELEFSTVRAPISGIVSQRLVKVGNMVRQHEAAFHITDFDPLLAVMHVPERELQRLRPSQKTTILVDALPDSRFEGRVKRISPVVDPGTGTFKVTIEVSDRSRQLKPGMFGRVLVTYDTHENTLLVPKAAVVREDDEASVFVIRDSVAYKHPVVVGYENGSRIEILNGLAAGDEIVVTGQAGLRDSSRVEPINI